MGVDVNWVLESEEGVEDSGLSKLDYCRQKARLHRHLVVTS